MWTWEMDKDCEMVTDKIGGKLVMVGGDMWMAHGNMWYNDVSNDVMVR